MDTPQVPPEPDDRLSPALSPADSEEILESEETTDETESAEDVETVSLEVPKDVADRLDLLQMSMRDYLQMLRDETNKFRDEKEQLLDTLNRVRLAGVYQFNMLDFLLRPTNKTDIVSIAQGENGLENLAAIQKLLLELYNTTVETADRLRSKTVIRLKNAEIEIERRADVDKVRHAATPEAKQERKKLSDEQKVIRNLLRNPVFGMLKFSQKIEMLNTFLPNWSREKIVEVTASLEKKIDGASSPEESK